MAGCEENAQWCTTAMVESEAAAVESVWAPSGGVVSGTAGRSAWRRRGLEALRLGEKGRLVVVGGGSGNVSADLHSVVSRGTRSREISCGR